MAQSSIELIFAIDENGLYAINGKLPWEYYGEKLRADLKHFKDITFGHVVVMGKHTKQSLGKPLPGRINIVVSKTEKHSSGFPVAKNLKEAIELAKHAAPGKTIFLIGGAGIWAEGIKLADRVHVTEVKKSYSRKANEGETLVRSTIPALLDEGKNLPSKEVKRESVVDEETGIACDFVTYEREQ